MLCFVRRITFCMVLLLFDNGLKYQNEIFYIFSSNAPKMPPNAAIAAYSPFPYRSRPPAPRHPSRTLTVRGDRLNELDARFVLALRDTMRVRTEAVLNTASTAWLERYAGLFDAVNVPFSSPEEWDRARCDAHRARNYGLELCIRTLVRPETAAVDLSAQLVVLAPSRWTLLPAPNLKGDEFRVFAAANARALEELDADVRVSWRHRK
jgi:hypothetical protein